MRIVSVINYKGGVGKTTVTSNVGAWLAQSGKRVLLIDMDPQASLTFSFVTPDFWESTLSSTRTIKAWFDSYSTSSTPLPLRTVVTTPAEMAKRLRARGKLDLIPSHLGLINVDLDLATQLGGATLDQVKLKFLNVHRRLADGLAAFGDSDYDVVLIDCPPNFNIVTKTALVASDYLLVPARPDYLSTLGIDYLMRSIGSLVKDYNDFAAIGPAHNTPKIELKNLGVVFTMIQEYNSGPIAGQNNFMQQVKRLPGLTVFDAYVKLNNTQFSDAPVYGVPVIMNEYNNASHKSVVDSLESVAQEFATRLGI